MVIMRHIQHCLTYPRKRCNGGWKIYHICSMSSIIKTPSVCVYSDASNLAWGSSVGEQEPGRHIGMILKLIIISIQKKYWPYISL